MQHTKLIKEYLVFDCAILMVIQNFGDQIRKTSQEGLSAYMSCVKCFIQPIGFDDCPKSLLTLPSRSPGLCLIANQTPTQKSDSKREVYFVNFKNWFSTLAVAQRNRD